MSACLALSAMDAGHGQFIQVEHRYRMVLGRYSTRFLRRLPSIDRRRRASQVRELALAIWRMGTSSGLQSTLGMESRRSGPAA